MIIESRFNGPPQSGNGGYSSGLIASYLPDRAGVEVTLRRPPPLEQDLLLRPIVRPAVGVSGIGVYHGDQFVAEAVPATLGDEAVVPPVDFAQAMAVSASFRGLVEHPFPTCFVCGPARAPGDGLRLFPGPLPDGRLAAPFVAPPDISEMLMWAALDCPGGWAVPLSTRTYLLGRIAARVDGVAVPGDKCVVMGVMTGDDGRKAYASTTIYSPAGEVLAVARATWIAIQKPGGLAPATR